MDIYHHPTVLGTQRLLPSILATLGQKRMNLDIAGDLNVLPLCYVASCPASPARQTFSPVAPTIRVLLPSHQNMLLPLFVRDTWMETRWMYIVMKNPATMPIVA